MSKATDSSHKADRLIESICKTLQSDSQINTASRILAGFSGGLDSSVLLHLIKKAYPTHQILSVHVNHALQAEADQWATHCEEVAKQLGVGFCHTKLTPPASSRNLEAWARQARYETFKKFSKSGDVLVLAHHADDQIETFLMRLFNGAGVQGLSGMKRILSPEKSLSNLPTSRPLLNYSRDQLECVAERLHINFITDPSNSISDFDRNYIRNSLTPRIKTRWPAYRAALLRSVAHIEEAREILDELAKEDLNVIRSALSETDLPMINEKQKLSITALKRLSLAKQRQVLRYWMSSFGFYVPSSKQLENLIESYRAEEQSAQIDFSNTQFALRRYRDILCILKADQLEQTTNIPLCFNDSDIENASSKITIQWNELKDVDCDYRLESNLCISHFQPAHKPYRMTLKKLFQEAGIPSWLREVIPGLYCDGELIGIPYIGVITDFVKSSKDDDAVVRSKNILAWKLKPILNDAN